MSDSSDEGRGTSTRTNALKAVSKAYCDAELKKCVIKYKTIRRNTRTLLEEEVFRAHRIKSEVRGIDDDALAAVRATWEPLRRAEVFRWQDQMRIVHQSHPRRLDLALWSGGQLCGLALARLSDNKCWLSLTFIEGSPIPSHPLKGLVVPITLIGADIYSGLVQYEAVQPIDKPQLRILNPLPGAMACYERQGYSEVVPANGYTYAVFKGDPS